MVFLAMAFFHKLMLYCSKNHLIAVGSFELAGGVPAEKIAMYDGQIWCGLGSHFNNTLLSIEVIDSTFIICGGFYYY